MSQFTVVQMQYKDQDCLVESLKEIGYPCTVHTESKLLRGDDRQSAHIVIDRHTARSYADIGFRQENDGNFSLVISDMDGKHREKIMSRLNVLYGKHFVLKQVKKLGLDLVSTKVDDEGKVHIKVLDNGW